MLRDVFMASLGLAETDEHYSHGGCIVAWWLCVSDSERARAATTAKFSPCFWKTLFQTSFLKVSQRTTVSARYFLK